MTTDLIARARAGDEEAFRQLIDPYRRELQVHCYRILGSVQDAEDALQETLLAAWRGLGGFEGRASIRTWLYRIATSRCLNALRSSQPAPADELAHSPRFDPPEPTRLGEVVWLEALPGRPPRRARRYRAPAPRPGTRPQEAISLAFVTALQLLPPRQRAVLILRDVLGFRAGEVAHILESTEESVTSALKRARATLQRRLAPRRTEEPPPPAELRDRAGTRRTGSPGPTQSGDVDGVIALLTDDVWLRHATAPAGVPGPRAGGPVLMPTAFRPGRTFRLVATRANGQPAFGIYVRDPHANVAHANGLLVLTLAGNRICAMTRFDNSVLPRFGFPRTWPD